MVNLNKLKDIVGHKRTLLEKKRLLDEEIEDIRIKKKLHQELIALKGNWKGCLKKAKDLQIETDEISTNIKLKKSNGKRGFRMSGLSIDIRENLDSKIINFFKLDVDKPISRIMIMKSIFNYIRTHELYKEGDRRFIDLTSSNPRLQELTGIFNMTTEGEAFRNTTFRSYLENFINT